VLCPAGRQVEVSQSEEDRKTRIVVDGEDEVAPAEKPLTGAALKAREAKLARDAAKLEAAARLRAFDPREGDDEPPFKFPKPGYDGPMVPYPFTDGGVNENAAIRMIKMVASICPADPRPTLLGRDGVERPNPRYNGDENCQMKYKINNMGRWRVDLCELAGHNPWYTEFRRRVVQDVVDSQGWVIEEKTRTKVEVRLNVIQVSDNPRHSTRMEVPLAQARGARFLSEFGILAPCEFRNCTHPVQVNSRYGNYCSERHARLVGADFRKVMLLVGGDPFTEEQALEEREEQLEQVNIRSRQG
jgi:hypothetical protein